MPLRSDPDRTSRPGLVVISNEQTPYRLHFHRRIAAEVPELHLWSVFTHQQASSPWTHENPEDINPVQFGAGETSRDQARLIYSIREWQKAARIIRWMRKRETAAVVVLGYNDIGRLRLIHWCHANSVPCFLFGDSNILGDRDPGRKAELKKVLLPRIVTSCSGVLCCGQLGRRYFIKYGVPPDRIFFMPYEPDYELLHRTSVLRVLNTRRRYALQPNRRHLLYSGRLEKVKRVDLAIRAFCAIASQRPQWDMVVAGTGTLAASLQSLVPVELKQRVVWTGFVSDAETLAALYTMCDVLVLPSDNEPWGVVLTEAAAVQTALVASSVVGSAEDLLQDEVNGKRFPKGDLQGLVGALLHVTDESRIDSMKAASARILGKWRRRADPIAGLRAALRSVGVLTRESAPQTEIACVAGQP